MAINRPLRILPRRQTEESAPEPTLRVVSSEEDEPVRRKLLGRDWKALSFETKVVAVIVVAGVLLSLFGLTHSLRARSSDLSRAQQLTAEIDEARVPVVQARSILDHPGWAKQQLRSLGAAFPDFPDEASLLQTVFGLANRYQLSLTGTDQSQPTTPTAATPSSSSAATVSPPGIGSAASIKEMTVTFSLTGKPTGILDFITALRSAPRLMTVSDLAFSFSHGATGTTTVPITATAYVGSAEG